MSHPRVAIITGAGQGIGAGVARSFAGGRLQGVADVTVGSQREAGP